MRVGRVLERHRLPRFFPVRTRSNSSPDMAAMFSRLFAKVKSVGRVTTSEPFCDKSRMSNGGTGPEALP